MSIPISLQILNYLNFLFWDLVANQFQFHSKFLAIDSRSPVQVTIEYVQIFYFGTLWPMSIPISLQILLTSTCIEMFFYFGTLWPMSIPISLQILELLDSRSPVQVTIEYVFSILGPCGQCQFQFHSKFLAFGFSILGPCGQCQFQFHSKFLTIGFFYFGTLWPMSIPIFTPNS